MNDLRAQTEALFEAAGLPVKYLAEGFIDYFLKEGKSPQQIYQIATRTTPESWCGLCNGLDGAHAEGCTNDRKYAV